MMRKDMSKVLCEGARTPRAKRTAKFPRPRKELIYDEDGAVGKSGKVGIRRPHQDHKDFGENLNPLLRFLQSRVGQKWDKVYSEIRKNISSSKTIDTHILLHLKQFVTTTGLYVDENGEVYHVRDYGLGPAPAYTTNEFYVHPETGILVNGKERQRREMNELKRRQLHFLNDNYRFLSSKEYLFRTGAVWYKYTFEDYYGVYACRILNREPYVYSEALKVVPDFVKRNLIHAHPYLHTRCPFQRQLLGKRQLKAYDLL